MLLTWFLFFFVFEQSFKRVKFWHMVDVISISAYFSFLPGRRGHSPDMEATKKMWIDKADYINKWRLRNKLGGKKVLIAEVGAQSKGMLCISGFVILCVDLNIIRYLTRSLYNIFSHYS